MDIFKANSLFERTREQTKIAREYAESRQKAVEARVQLLAILTPALSGIRARKANVGTDMAILMLCETSDLAKELYSIELRETAKYKGLEKILEALQSEISYAQSVMKYEKEGEQYGG